MRTAIVLFLITAQLGWSWGVRGHYNINRAAVRAIPEDGPAFLKNHEDWIVYLSVIPDSWRAASEPALKILEDPNHGWFSEQFAFMKQVPRSRYEFVLALYEENKKLAAKDPEAAKLVNVRWTGTLPYAAQENYERMKAAMRRYRAAKTQNQDTRFVELEIASYMGRLGHYTGDGAQPLHDTIHHDGWAGENPKDYTREPRVHGAFESAFVDLIELKGEDFEKLIEKPKHLEDPFAAMISHLELAFSKVEDVYKLEKSGALKDKDNAEARQLVYQRIASGAEMLRDLTYTAWLESAKPSVPGPGGNPISPKHPNYNPQTGSAPPGPPVSRK